MLHGVPKMLSIDIPIQEQLAMTHIKGTETFQVLLNDLRFGSVPRKCHQANFITASLLLIASVSV
jgi:hypothetical protein